MTSQRLGTGIGCIIFTLGAITGVLLGTFVLPQNSKVVGTRVKRHYANTYHSRTLQRTLIDEVKPKNIRKYLRKLAMKPHLAGTPADKEQAKEMARFWKSLGLKTKISSYKILLSYPDTENPNKIELQNGKGKILHTTRLTEEIFEPEQNHSDIVPPFNAYSAKGKPKGKLVYVNYGRFEDFEWLTEEKKMDLKGHICIARYGKIFRGNKAELADMFGCSGLILYSDPRDTNGGLMDSVYPNSQYLPGTGVERGHIGIKSTSIGDPLTPGYPAKKSAYRIPESDAILPKIPVHAIGYDDAKRFLEEMSGDPVPAAWMGGLNITYRLGPGFQQNKWRVQMHVANKNELRKTYNVFGILRGSDEPDRYVLLGNHRDAWVFGGADPSSGTAAMMEASRVLSKAYREGWRPRRTIIFCSWGAEEYGHLGSREWIEDYRHLLMSRAVAYINVDIAVLGNFTFVGRGLPLAHNLLYEVAKVIPNPHDYEGSSVYDTWSVTIPEVDTQGQPTGRPFIVSLGSNSDFAPFIEYTGITVMDFFYYSDYRRQLTIYPLYHTAQDTFNLVDKFIDPKYTFHRTITQFWQELVRRLADDLVLPFKVSDYSSAIKLFVSQIENLEGGFIAANGLQRELDYLREAAEEMHAAAKGFQKRLRHVSVTNPLALRMMNDQIMQLERAFVDPLGLPGRPYAKHTVLAPSTLNGYEGTNFPGIIDSLFNITKATGEEKTQRWENVKKQISIATYFIQSTVALLNRYEDF